MLTCCNLVLNFGRICILEYASFGQLNRAIFEVITAVISGLFTDVSEDYNASIFSTKEQTQQESRTQTYR